MENPFDELEAEIRRADAETEAAKRLSHARTMLILGKANANPATCVFFAALVCKTSGKFSRPNRTIPTLSTDGTHLDYNPDFVVGLSMPELVGCLVHEVMHCAMLHHTRLAEMPDQELANIAGDLAINGPIREAGFTLPAGVIYPGEGAYADLQRGQSAEHYYHALTQRKQQQRQQEGGDTAQDGQQGPSASQQGQSPQAGHAPAQPGQGHVDPGSFSAPTSPTTGATDPGAANESKVDWQVATAAAASLAKDRGELPGGLGVAITDALLPKTDPWDVLRDFLTNKASEAYSWNRPDRRFIGQGIYLPARNSPTLGEIVFMVDHSGSISQDEVNVFAGNAEAILEMYHCRLRVLFHTHQVTHEQRWEPGDGPLVLELPKESGGTSHAPCFEYLEAEGVEPTCVVAFTDLYSVFPDAEPSFPVMWASTGADRAPWGEVVMMERS